MKELLLGRLLLVLPTYGNKWVIVILKRLPTCLCEVIRISWSIYLSVIDSIEFFSLSTCYANKKYIKYTNLGHQVSSISASHNLS